jgi:predicted aldo/keto reductase-like oxidoreductase
MLIATVVKYKVGQIYGAYTRENTLCAAALFVWSHQKVFLLLFGFDKIGKKEQALEVLIDEFIKLHAEQNLTLRFEFTLQKKYSGLYSGFGGQRYEFLKIRRINFLS